MLRRPPPTITRPSARDRRDQIGQTPERARLRSVERTAAEREEARREEEATAGDALLTYDEERPDGVPPKANAVAEGLPPERWSSAPAFGRSFRASLETEGSTRVETSEELRE